MQGEAVVFVGCEVPAGWVGMSLAILEAFAC